MDLGARREKMFGELLGKHIAYVKELLGFSEVVPNKFRVLVCGSTRVDENEPAYDEARDFGRILSKAGISTVLPGHRGIAQAVAEGNQSIGSSSSAIWAVHLNYLSRLNAYPATRVMLANDEALRLDILGVLGTQFVFFRPGLGTNLTLAWVLQLVQLMRSKGRQDVSDSLYFVSRAVRRGWIPKIVLVGEHFGYIDEMMATMVGRKTISPEDVQIYERVSTASEAAELACVEKSRFDAFMREAELNPNEDYDEARIEDGYRRVVDARQTVVEALYALRNVSGYRYTFTHFGSARPRPADLNWAGAWESARNFGTQLCDFGVDLMSGGGPGIMEAFLAGGCNATNGTHTLGATLKLPREVPNSFIQQHFPSIDFNLRLGVFGVYSTEYGADPYGGLGTYLEVIWVWKNVQRHKRALAARKPQGLYLAASSVALGWMPKIVVIGFEPYRFLRTQLKSMLAERVPSGNDLRLPNGTVDYDDYEIIHPAAGHQEASYFVQSRKVAWQTYLEANGVTPEN